MSKKPSLKRFLLPPGLGRNLARRSGGGPHELEEKKRAADKLRREIAEQQNDRSKQPPP